ncbi:MAG: hypothetical protein JRG97_04530 [Deltaproteobacteria bacterium]|nr:hypothetical protein [Deltaproteobacteria bacterium]MBW2051257.1 hypothetical protein [Deltaproteobacteria bacterium]MBW2140325.1 hypothetical protein [Deltaproteobacteria bacterium]MBW2323560.1 hypothetical protein [Deltaproteobacteria bacterium]
MDAVKAFANCPIPRGNRVAILTRGGGWGVITADACEESGLVVPPLPDDIIKKIDKILPKFWSRGNPIDMVATISADPFTEIMEILIDWDGIDAIVALGGMGKVELQYSKDVQGPPELISVLSQLKGMKKMFSKDSNPISNRLMQLVAEGGKPIISVSLGSSDSHKEILENYKLVSFPTPERAVRVLRLMAEYRRFLESTALN